MCIHSDFTRMALEAHMKIEKNIPLPEPARGKLKWPWPDMEVGDSIKVDPERYKRAQLSAQQWKRNHPGFNYATRKLPNGERRIWRVEAE